MQNLKPISPLITLQNLPTLFILRYQLTFKVHVPSSLQHVCPHQDICGKLDPLFSQTIKFHLNLDPAVSSRKFPGAMQITRMHNICRNPASQTHSRFECLCLFLFLTRALEVVG